MRIILLLLLAAGGFSQAQATDESAKHSLWVVRGGASPVFLMGSVHMLPPSEHPLPAVFDLAYGRSSVLVFEILLDTASQHEAQAELMTRGRLVSERSLRSALPETLWQSLTSACRALGIPVRAVESMKPWMASLTLFSFRLAGMGYAPELGVDLGYHRRAERDGKRIIAMESASFQAQLLDGMTREEELQFVRETIDDVRNLDAELGVLVRAWRTGNTHVLDSLLLDGRDLNPELYEKLIYARNRAWMERIMEFLASSETHLVIVGAGHLVGDRGLVAELRRRGYSVEQW